MSAKENISKLPEYCYSQLNTTGEVIKICSGMSGFYRQEQFMYIKRELQHGVSRKDLVNKLNIKLGVTPEQKEAMEIGSMFGWEVPGANADMYETIVVAKITDR